MQRYMGEHVHPCMACATFARSTGRDVTNTPSHNPTKHANTLALIQFDLPRGFATAPLLRVTATPPYR